MWPAKSGRNHLKRKLWRSWTLRLRPKWRSKPSWKSTKWHKLPHKWLVPRPWQPWQSQATCWNLWKFCKQCCFTKSDAFTHQNLNLEILCYGGYECQKNVSMGSSIWGLFWDTDIDWLTMVQSLYSLKLTYMLNLN